MAKLTAKQRNALKANQFAGPDRSYPVDTKARASNAKARATQAVKAGRMSKSQEAKIDAKANKKLGEKGAGANKRDAGRTATKGSRNVNRKPFAPAVPPGHEYLTKSKHFRSANDEGDE